MGNSFGVPAEQARALMQSRARTFYLAALFLPPGLRRDVHIVYAFSRSVDDLVDEPPADWTRACLLTELDRLAGWVGGDDRDAPEIVRAVNAVLRRNAVPPAYVSMILGGARQDVDLRRVETRDELLDYATLVAGSVGMIMAHLLGATGPYALSAACDLGVAMQLTNVVRDVGEDLERGRVYLPADVLRAAGCTLEELHAQRVTPAFRAALTEIMSLARAHYERGFAGIQYVDRRAQFSIYLAATLYAGILDKIEHHGYDVFNSRANIGPLEKWALTVPIYLRHRLATR